MSTTVDLTLPVCIYKKIDNVQYVHVCLIPNVFARKSCQGIQYKGRGNWSYSSNTEIHKMSQKV